MALAAGTRFGSYEISDEIGAGGMGEVYRATDTELERDVAIKVLPESFSTDGDWVARFEREAKTLAALNHPNIAHIYGLERNDGAIALVMELVEGPTLADKIAEGALPADEALGIAMQIADALEAAHGQGIVHRDLKPANIKLRSDGTVKVLDFGIAKTLDIRAASGQPAAQMTTPAMTQTGVILGTAAYMSPEQARGRPIDGRTDIWAFGCVLFEMLTGQPAFAGEDVAITLARILANDTDLKSLPGMISPAVRHTIEMCLKKDERKRIADIRDVRLALEGEFESLPVQTAAGEAAAAPIWRRAVPYAGVAMVTALAVLILARGLWSPAGDAQHPPVTRFEHALDPQRDLRITAVRVITFAPDGSNFVYNTNEGLFRRTMGQLGATLIPGTEPNIYAPTFSPDGQWLAYITTDSNQLSRIAATGGAPVLIAELDGNIGDLSWEANGTMLFNDEAGIWRASIVTGTTEVVVPGSPDEYLYGPRLLPDGETILMTVFQAGSGSWDNAQIVAHSLATGERKLLVSGGADARYLPTGHLVYAFGDGLFAVPFDADTVAVSGAAVPIVTGVMRAAVGQTGVAQFDVAANGTLVYVAGGQPNRERELVWVDRNGVETSLGAEPRNYTTPRISPDGTKIALDVREEGFDIWIWDIERELSTRLTFGPEEDEFPAWTPDSQRVAYAFQNRSVYWQAADGAGERELIAEDDGQLFPMAFTEDAAQLIVFGAQTGSEQDDIRRVHLIGGGTGEIEPLLESSFVERDPALSPDGRWLAYSSTQSGTEEIYVRPFPDINAGGGSQISSGGGREPVWAHSGEELFFRDGDAVMVVPVETEPTFRPGRQQMLFEGAYAMAPPGGRTYDVEPGDERFLMIKESAAASASVRMIVVENWFEELERLVPTD